jgi:hypothetical protein
VRVGREGSTLNLAIVERAVFCGTFTTRSGDSGTFAIHLPVAVEADTPATADGDAGCDEE